MQHHHLSVHFKRSKRLGRGCGSRRGTYSGRGVKGQKARAGARIRPGFEGGQTPLYARLPKRRGFRAFQEKGVIVQVGQLEQSFAAGATITRSALRRARLIPPRARRVKILGNGEVTKALTLSVPVSASAKAKIEKAGGKVVTNDE